MQHNATVLVVFVSNCACCLIVAHLSEIVSLAFAVLNVKVVVLSQIPKKTKKNLHLPSLENFVPGFM